MIIPTPRNLVLLLSLAFLPGAAFAAPADWAKEIDKYSEADAIAAPPSGGVVFVGSSSIRLWSTLAQDFPGVPVINRGFGGSQLPDIVHYIDRVVIPYRPSAVVVYAGENDIWAGATPTDVVAAFVSFRDKLHAALPQARLLFISIKESPSRARVRAAVQEANRLIAALCAQDARCVFVDITAPMLDAQGGFRPELFIQDQLHLNAAGYAIWTKALAPHLARR